MKKIITFFAFFICFLVKAGDEEWSVVAEIPKKNQRPLIFVENVNVYPSIKDGWFLYSAQIRFDKDVQEVHVGYLGIFVFDKNKKIIVDEKQSIFVIIKEDTLFFRKYIFLGDSKEKLDELTCSLGVSCYVKTKDIGWVKSLSPQERMFQSVGVKE